MKNIIEIIIKLPKWYSLSIVLVYSLLQADFISTINCFDKTVQLSGFYYVIMKINFIASFFSGFVMWFLMSLIFHLTALLFGGKFSFNHFLHTTSYPYIIPALALVICIIIMDNTELNKIDNYLLVLLINILNCSFIFYYLMIVVMIRYLYNIGYLFSILSILIPVSMIGLVIGLFKYI